MEGNITDSQRPLQRPSRRTKSVSGIEILAETFLEATVTSLLVVRAQPAEKSACF
jgi:hypothetical protein